MKIGDYVRTDTGIIEKIEKIYKHNETNDTHIQLNRMGTGKSVFILDKNEELLYSKGEVIKSSPDIIDLIEVGDYVNGLKVSRVDGTYHGRKDKAIYCDYCENKETGKWTMIYDDEIKSIVTKEQFENMKYEVKE